MAAKVSWDLFKDRKVLCKASKEIDTKVSRESYKHKQVHCKDFKDLTRL
jgi:hypothetical protein